MIKFKKITSLITIMLFMLFSFTAQAGLEDRGSDITLKARPNNYILGPELSANPSGNPASGWWRLFGVANKLYFEDDAGTITDLITVTGTTAFDDIGDPDAAGTIAMTTFAQTFTSTKTDGDMFNFQGLGAFGDVSVVRIESKTGNPTDGTVLEVVSHDANVDPLVVSTSGQAGVLTVGQDGTVAIVGATTITGATSVTGKISATTGVSTGSATDSTLRTDTVEITNGQIKGLRAAPKELVATPGADYFIEFVSAVLILDYGSEALTESADNLVIQYGTSGADVSGAIESGSFIDATADTITFVPPAALVGLAATSAVNDNLVLFNTGDGEIAGNASGDTTITAKVTYRIHKAGL